MPSLNEIIPDLEISSDERIRVFRRTFHAIKEFEGMEVDAYIVITDHYVIVLDTLLCPEDVSFMMQSVKNQLRGRSLLCINSHADWDHAWGNCYFTGENLAPIIAHDHCLTRLQSTEAHKELLDFQQLSSTFKNVFLLPPTITFNQHFTIHGRNLTIELLHAPGHHLDLEQLIALQPLHVLCSHGKTNSPDQLKQNLSYICEIERRCKSVLQKRKPGVTDLVHVSELINYSFNEVVGNTTETIDRIFYTQAHENNCQAIMKWLMNTY